MSESGVPEQWRALLDEHRRRLDEARAMGGEDRLARRRASGRLNAREVIDRLVDAGSFMELGTLVGGLAWHGLEPTPADALVGGPASIDGRAAVVAAEDFTVQGGSIGHGTNAKRVRLARLAAQERVPYVMILDGAGARATNALERHPYAPNDLQELAALSGKVPTVALVIGSSAGHGALTGLMMDLIVMTEGATMFAAGPPLVEAALGERVGKQELGGARVHTETSGVAHNVVADEAEGCDFVRRYLAYLPDSAWEYPPGKPDGTDTGPRRLEDILEIVPCDPHRPYDIRRVMETALDAGSLLEIQPGYGRAIVTALARLGGQPVAVVGNQPQHMAGAIDHTAAEKAAHFLDLANAWHLPALFLADNPGVMSGSRAERAGTLRAAARMYAAQAALSVPKLHVTLRKAFGFGSSLMAMNPFDDQTISLAFPGISLGGMPASGGGSAAGADSERQAALEEAEQSGAWVAGDNMAYDEIIDPRELRNALLKALAFSRNRRTEAPAPAMRHAIRP